MALTSAEAEVRIVPSMRGFGQKVRAGVKATRVDPLEIQVRVDRKSLAQAEQAARSAAERVVKARAAEQKSSEDLRLAEARLAEERKKSAAGSASLIAAENRLEQVKRSAVAASSSLARAHADEARSKSAVVAANQRLESSYRRLQSSASGLSGVTSRLRNGFMNLDTSSLKKADRELTQASRSALKLGAYSTAAAGGLVAIGNSTGVIVALTAALASAAGAAALIPAALAGAGASFGAVKLGLSGVADAFKESGKAADASGSAGASAAKEQLQRTRGIRDATQALAKAQTNAARVRADGERRVSDALRAQRDTAVQGSASIKAASDSVLDARRRAADAERDYRDAVKETVLALRDLKVELKSSSLSVEEAELNLDRAKQRLEELKAAGTSNPLDMREAELSVRRANISLEEAKNRYTDVARESAEANATGVNGARRVVDAARNVSDANKSVRDSEVALKSARTDAARANADAARAVADAQRDSREANADAADAIRDANERLQDAYAQTGSSAESAADKAAAALAKLSPNARAFVQQVLAMRGAWDDLKNSVQDRLFAGTAEEVRLLGDRYLPILKSRLSDIAGSFNTAALETSGFLRSATGVAQVDKTLANTSRTSDQLARATAPLVNIFTGFASVGSEYLPGLASGFADAAERGAAFVNSVEGAQKIRGWIEGGLTAIRQLWEFLKNVGGIIGGVFRAMNEAGASTMQMLVDITGQMDAWVNSAEGQDTLVKIFTTIRDVVNELKPGVSAVLGAVKDAFITLAPSLPGLAEAFSNIVIALSPLVGWIANALKWLIDNALIPFGRWAKDNPGAVQTMAVAVGGLVLAIKGLNMVKSLMTWVGGIQSAFGLIKRDADKAADAVGDASDPKNRKGLAGRLSALKGIGSFALGVTAIITIDEATDGAVTNLLNYLSGREPIDVNDRTRDIFGALPAVPGDEGDIRNLPATLSRIKQDSDKNWGELTAGVKSAFTAPPPVPGDELDVRNLPQTFQRIKGQSDKNWEELKTNVTNFSGQAWSGVTGWWNRTKTDVGNRVTELKDGASARFSELKSNVSSRASETWAGVSGWWNRTKTDVGNRASELATNAGSRLRELRDNASSRASELWSNVSGWWNRTSADVGTKARELKDNAVARATELRDAFGDRIRALVDGVGRKWDELKGLFARPIKWVIDAVWNGTIANLWGKARGLIPSLPEFKYLAAGGPVHGPGGPTADRIPAMLSDGEHVLDARDVRNLGGHGGVMALRSAAERGLLPRFADGGPVSWQELRDTVERAIPGTRMSSGYRPGHAGEHGKGLAADFVGNLPAIQNWIVSRFPASHEIIGPVERQNIFNGRQHRYDAATVAGHKDHVHWARKEHGKGLLANIVDGISSAWNVVSTFFRDGMASIYDGPANALRGLVGRLYPGDALSNRIPKDGTNMILDHVRDFLFGKADAEDAMANGDMIADGGPTTGDQLGNARVIGNVARALGFGRNGVVVALATALQESGLRNINYGDRDSVGLFQQRPSQGWGSVAQIMNPSYSASKFFNALRAVAGWERMPVTVAAQRVQRSAFPDAYAKWVGKANSLASQIGFANGGTIPGRPGRDDKLALVQGGERVLTPDQNTWLESALRAASMSGAVSQVQRGHGLGSLVGAVPGGGSRGALIENFHAHESLDADRAVSRLAFLAGGL